ncbi:MAG: S1C family serine protease [Sulfurifustaceae bacterium]
MRKEALYSSSRTRSGDRSSGEQSAERLVDSSQAPLTRVRERPAQHVRARLRRFYDRRRPWVAAVAGVLAVALLVGAHFAVTPRLRPLTQDDVDAAVLHTLETKHLPSRAAKAYQIIRPSVVRVRGFNHGDSAEEVTEASVGTGVVVVDDGSILTNLHVVAEAERISVTFADGSESRAAVVGARPEQDLAVIRASELPDDLVPAVLRSTQGLAMGDEVVAVGFPFGIGPSVSAGVISGLRREYRAPEGKRALANLIQFDAAVNPGNSGGPLVTADGEVVGIVTGLLNPTEERFFIGIGFAVPIESAAAAAGMPPF